jgi:hypothetical protein
LRGLVIAAAALGSSIVVGCTGLVTHPAPPTPAAKVSHPVRPAHLELPFKITTSDDAVVRIVTDVTCTGTLIADDLVLTAHHCVASRDDHGRTLRRDQDPQDVSIELGGEYMPWGEVNVRAIVSPDCGYTSGDGDIAILVLSRRLVGMPTHSARIQEEPTRSEYIEPIGFGQCALSAEGIHRIHRLGGGVDAVNPFYFVASTSICPGDSGGPALSHERGDVVGVVSASVMDGDERTAGISYFTRLDRWRQLFSAAREIAAGASPSELPPYRSCHP